MVSELSKALFARRIKFGWVKIRSTFYQKKIVLRTKLIGVMHENALGGCSGVLPTYHRVKKSGMGLNMMSISLCINVWCVNRLRLSVCIQQVCCSLTEHHNGLRGRASEV